MGRISEYVKLRIYANFKRNAKICNVVKELKENDDIVISRNTVARWYKKFRESGSLILADKKSSGRPSLVKKCHMDFIDQKLEENDELNGQKWVKEVFRVWGNID
jgi:transposase